MQALRRDRHRGEALLYIHWLPVDEVLAMRGVGHKQYRPRHDLCPAPASGDIIGGACSRLLAVRQGDLDQKQWHGDADRENDISKNLNPGDRTVRKALVVSAAIAPLL